MVIKKSKKFLAATNAMSIFSKWENKLTISKHLMVAFKRLIQRCSVVKVDKRKAWEKKEIPDFLYT